MSRNSPNARTLGEQDPRSKQDAPHPDAERKVDWPTQVEKPSWKYIARKVVREFSDDQCIDIAASLTYYGVLSLFPGLLVVMSLLGLFGQSGEAVRAILDIVRQLAPSETVQLIEAPLRQFVDSPAAGFALVSGIVLGIWSASAYVTAFSRGMNRIYEVVEGRPFWKLKPQQLLITICLVVLVIVMITLLVISGPVTDAVGNALGIGDTARTVWSIAKWPVLAIAAVVIIALLYYTTPNVKQPKFRWMSVGALIALVVIVLATLAFGLYVTNFSNYDRTYGSLAGVIIFLLWLWITNMVLLFGAEVDAELERGRQLQAGIEAERSVQLPPRDTRKSDKLAAKAEEDIERGRELRERAAAEAAAADQRRREQERSEREAARRAEKLRKREAKTRSGATPPAAPPTAPPRG
ncbi:YihY/virulence factor BrkB family protein [Ruicaihuangia caeni]|uniref:YihY/virulence factor BrkB family protein n=1 Tax=Ruicaihuangia caeni TaxID=3042517 RepID=A0AAW6T6U1_9MICO|nr:YihY/virulence factor BrkB family protein [Klugiella sp. YN-L-19]MDI2098949.1 YihY/virulence factor BrkB family protein [Klugiella sp. YN-L-19]